MAILEEVILQEIEQQGPMPFARFMDLALYCPKIGYYERTKDVIGRTGDYNTSVSSGSLFGQFLAFQFSEWLESMAPGPKQLVEAGAHDGRLAHDILSWLGQNRPSLAGSLQYSIIEPSATRQIWRKRTLEDFAGQVGWFDQVSSLPISSVSGVIFSNEFFDAFPVHRLGWDARRQTWFEWGVTAQSGKFIWQKLHGTLSASELQACGPELPRELAAVLPDEFTIEISPAATRWWNQAARALCQGKLLTIDYGLTAEEWLAPHRPHGTLRAYQRHHLCADLLANVGEQDLTAHVNFTQLQRAGETAGLRTDGLWTQAQFLTRIAEKFWQKESSLGGGFSDLARSFQTLTHPEHLGRPFRVLLQSI